MLKKTLTYSKYNFHIIKQEKSALVICYKLYFTIYSIYIFTAYEKHSKCNKDVYDYMQAYLLINCGRQAEEYFYRKKN